MAARLQQLRLRGAAAPPLPLPPPAAAPAVAPVMVAVVVAVREVVVARDHFISEEMEVV